jgi:hypothetical protein
MGLHSEMRTYFRNTFPDSVLQHLPSCDVQIVDFMWHLYRFFYPRFRVPSARVYSVRVVKRGTILYSWRVGFRFLLRHACASSVGKS